ncbi:MAG: hypothetical protein ACLP07_07260 [Terracidiphilus sp.]
MALAAAVNFGPVRVGSHQTAVVNVTIPGEVKLGAVAVRTEGAENLDFTSAGKPHCRARNAHDGNRVCVIRVTFKPLYSGRRYGAVILADDGGNIVGTTYIDGMGLAPQAIFMPGTETPISGISHPNGLAVDEQGNLYVTDYQSGSLYKETLLSNGGYSQSTVANGLFSIRAVAVDGAGNIFVGGPGVYIVKETLQLGGGYKQSRIGSDFGATGGLAVDGSGNIYVTDYNFGRVFKEAPSFNGTYTQTMIANGLDDPTGIAADSHGNLYIATQKRICIERLSGRKYMRTSIAGAFRAPQGVALDGIGDIYVSDYSTRGVYKETVTGGAYVESLLVTNVGGNYVAVDGAGNLYVSDADRGTITRIDGGDPPSLSFAATRSREISADSPQSVVVFNLGNLALRFSAVNYPADFPKGRSHASPCRKGTALPAGGACTLTISFSPIAPSPNGNSIPISEKVTVMTNTLGAAALSQAITVTGLNAGSELPVSPP